jgi:hypothetical protein
LGLFAIDYFRGLQTNGVTDNIRTKAQSRHGSKFGFPLSPTCLVDESGAKREGFDSIKAARRRAATRRRA